MFLPSHCWLQVTIDTPRLPKHHCRHREAGERTSERLLGSINQTRKASRTAGEPTTDASLRSLLHVHLPFDSATSATGVSPSSDGGGSSRQMAVQRTNGILGFWA